VLLLGAAVSLVALLVSVRENHSAWEQP